MTLLDLTDAVASDGLVVGVVPATTPTTTITAQPAPIWTILDNTLDDSQLELLAILESQPPPMTTTTTTMTAQPQLQRDASVPTTEVDSDSSDETTLLPLLKRLRQ